MGKKSKKNTAKSDTESTKSGKGSTSSNEPKESLTDPHRLAVIHLRRFEFGPPVRKVRFWQDQWWVWDGRRYAVLPATDQRALVTESIKWIFDSDRARIAQATGEEPEFRGQVTRGLVSNVLQALQSLTLVPAWVEQPSWLGSTPSPAGDFIAMTNGLIDVDALLTGNPNLLRPHSADWFSPVCLDYPYDPHAICPGWLKLLGEALEQDADRISLVQEWFGYCLIHDTSLQKFMVIVGDGANGKTVVILVLVALLGKDNVSHVALEQFEQRFHLASTLGRLANVATEIGEIDRAAEGALKAYVSGDPMFFDRKHLSGVQARPTARLLFTTNNLPQFKDRSSGVWRRMIVLPFRVVIPPEKQDPHLVDKLRLELPGIFNWAVAGLRRLRQQGHFTEAVVCREALEVYRIEANPARAFLLECVVAKKGDSIVCAKLYVSYGIWCKDRGFQVLNAAQLGHEVRRAFPKVERVKAKGGPPSGGRVWSYAGIALALPNA